MFEFLVYVKNFQDCVLMFKIYFPKCEKFKIGTFGFSNLNGFQVRRGTSSQCSCVQESLYFETQAFYPDYFSLILFSLKTIYLDTPKILQSYVNTFLFNSFFGILGYLRSLICKESRKFRNP